MHAQRLVRAAQIPPASLRKKTRRVHFVRYLPDQQTALYRRTADSSHAALTVANVPANVSDRKVEIVANLTKLTTRFGIASVVDYAQLGMGRFVDLYRTVDRREC